MSKYVTGFCSNGFCEGTRPKSASGKPVKVCEFINVCQCECHKKLTDMFELAEKPRIVLQNPDYVPYESGIKEFLASFERLQAEVLPGSQAVKIVEVPVTSDDGTIMTGLRRSGKTFEPTKRGRASGQLEDEIRGVCNRFFQGEFPDEQCTPKFIAAKIAEEASDGKTPSVGAVGAAFDRWDKIGFAVIKRGPVRFEGFTVAGLTQGLDALKDAAKSQTGRRLRSAR